jgi:hypothetical protein
LHDPLLKEAIMRAILSTLGAALVGVMLVGDRSLLSASVDAAPLPRTIRVPAGTTLPIVLDSYVASDTSRIEDTVRAKTRRAVVIGDDLAIPAGSTLVGHVTSVQRSGRVKGRARIAMRFDRLILAGSGERVNISTSAMARQAPATKARDAKTIGFPAAGGAVIGALAGGKKGAAIGAAAGGGAGTAVVLSTRGREVRLGRGATGAVRLLQPVTIRSAR